MEVLTLLPSWTCNNQSSLSDEQDILSRHNAFIGQVNNVLWELHSVVKARLFHSYCTSCYGYVLWDLLCSALNDFCIAWRKSIRRIWNLPYQALLPLLCGCLPVFDDICLRFINFVCSCITHQSTLVSSITWYSITYGRFSSPAMLCTMVFMCCGGLNIQWFSAQCC